MTFQDITLFLQYGLAFVVALGILVFIHELGHYIAARLNNVKVDVFSIGFGKELFGWNDTHGTRWRLSLIPLGGYVKLYGDADETSRPDITSLNDMNPLDKEHSLHAKHPLQKISVSIAGPVANFLFAIVVLAGLFMTIGQPFHAPVISTIHPGTPAEKAGFQIGDRITIINGYTIETFEHATQIIEQFGENPLQLVINRQDQLLPFTILADKTSGGVFGKNIYKIGVSAQEIVYVPHSPENALGAAIEYVGRVIKGTLGLFQRLISGQSSNGEIGGPLRIAQMAGQAINAGLADFLSLLALLSISLGVINLMPVPMLDGGHVLLYTIEWISGKPIDEKIQEIVYKIGMIFVVGLMIISFWNDLNHLKIITFIKNLF